MSAKVTELDQARIDAALMRRLMGDTIAAKAQAHDWAMVAKLVDLALAWEAGDSRAAMPLVAELRRLRLAPSTSAGVVVSMRRPDKKGGDGDG